jgi:hypothetical protein
VEQDKSKDIAKNYQAKILHDLLEDVPPEEDEYLQTILNDGDLKNKIEQILEGIESEGQGGVEAAINQLIMSLIEEINEQFPSQTENLSQYKAKFAAKMNSLKIFLLMKGTKQKKNLSSELSEAAQKQKKQAKQQIKNLLKRFIIYEVYKIMNPKRIAGETKVANFINNMIVGGLKRAVKYEGGRKRDLSKYSPKMIKTLNKYHNKFKGSSRGLQI